MKRNIGTLLASSPLVASVAAQETQDSWPKRETTAFTAIREGATEYNNPGYWQEGTFSTVTSADREQDLEVTLTLHNPAQKEGYTYLQWI